MRRLHLGLAWVPALLLISAGATAVECASKKLNDGTVTVCKVDLRHEQLQLYWRDDTGQPSDLKAPAEDRVGV